MLKNQQPLRQLFIGRMNNTMFGKQKLKNQNAPLILEEYAKGGIIEIQTFPQSGLCSLLYQEKRSIQPYTIQNGQYHIACPFCGSLNDEWLLYYEKGWRCPSCTKWTNPLEAEMEEIGKDRINKVLQGDYRELERLLRNPNPEKRTKGIRLARLAGVGFDGDELNLKRSHPLFSILRVIWVG